MARPLNDVVKELQDAMVDVQSKREVLTVAEKAMNEAAVEHRNAQDKAAALKQELDSMFNGFLGSTDSRVRTSH